ncbi:MAG: response regulator, partial [bacterium]|nr:response regulator [bacterium]
MQKILLLEDNQQDADLIRREIVKRWPGIDLFIVSRLSEAKELIESDNEIEVALFDLKLPDGSGMDLLIELRAALIEIPIIILTGKGTEDIAISALKVGANDYISKKIGFHKRIPDQIEFTLNHARQNQQNISVLYVEHHASDVDLTLHHLKKHASYIHLTKVNSGEEALSLLPSSSEDPCKFDVLMLDYRLHGLNAIEISKIVRQERGLSIAIVIVTGQGDESIAVEAMKIGVDDYIVKHENYIFRLPSVLTSAFRRRELERQQQALKQSELKYKRLFNEDLSGNFIASSDGKILLCNSALANILGFNTIDELMTKNISSFYKQPKCWEQLINQLNQKKKIEQFECELLLPDGREISVIENVVGDFDETGKLLQLKGYLLDNTQRKHGEEQLIKLNN